MNLLDLFKSLFSINTPASLRRKKPRPKSIVKRKPKSQARKIVKKRVIKSKNRASKVSSVKAKKTALKISKFSKSVSKKKLKKTTLKKKITTLKKTSPPKKTAKKSAIKKKKAAPLRTKPLNQVDIGTITHYFNKISVAIVKLKGPVSVGCQVRIMSSGIDFTQTISSMQHNHSPIELGKKGMEIGIKTIKKASVGAKVFRVD